MQALQQCSGERCVADCAECAEEEGNPHLQVLALLGSARVLRLLPPARSVSDACSERVKDAGCWNGVVTVCQSVMASDRQVGATLPLAVSSGEDALQLCGGMWWISGVEGGGLWLWWLLAGGQGG